MPDPLKFKIGDSVQIAISARYHPGEFGFIHLVDPSLCILPYCVHFRDDSYEWFRAESVLERPEPGPNRTIEVTPHMATAQDLLHEVISLREQLKNFLGFEVDYIDAAKSHLERIFGEEAAKQIGKTNKEKQ